MNILVTSLLTISLLVVAPGCKKECKATYIDANNQLQTEYLAASSTEDDAVASPNVKC